MGFFYSTLKMCSLPKTKNESIKIKENLTYRESLRT